MAREKREIDYINVIADLRRAGRSNRVEIMKILYRYDIPKIESLERRVLDFVFSVTDDEHRFNLIDIIAEANNLPIIHECYYIIYSELSKQEYVSCQVKNVGKSRDSFSLKYEICTKIIGQSSLLQRLQKTVYEKKSELLSTGGVKVVSHRYRNRRATRE